MSGSGKGRPVAVEIEGEQGPVKVSALVSEAVPSSAEEVEDALRAIDRVRGERWP